MIVPGERSLDSNGVSGEHQVQKELESSLDALERQSSVVVGDNRLQQREPLTHPSLHPISDGE